MWTLAVQNSDELIYVWSFEPVEKCTTFEDTFPELSRTLSFNFQAFRDQSDFPGLSRSWNFQEKNPGLFRRRGNPVMLSGVRVFQLRSHQRWRSLVNSNWTNSQILCRFLRTDCNCALFYWPVNSTLGCRLALAEIRNVMYLADKNAKFSIIPSTMNHSLLSYRCQVECNCQIRRIMPKTARLHS